MNIDIDFKYMPCGLLELDVLDIMGNSRDDVQGELQKMRLDSNGTPLGEEHNESALGKQPTESMKPLKDAVKNREGCKFIGKFYVNNVFL